MGKKDQIILLMLGLVAGFFVASIFFQSKPNETLAVAQEAEKTTDLTSDEKGENENENEYDEFKGKIADD